MLIYYSWDTSFGYSRSPKNNLHDLLVAIVTIPLNYIDAHSIIYTLNEFLLGKCQLPIVLMQHIYLAQIR